ncbi:hypothetical protein SAMN05216252_13448 [Actinacidiphila glaucinigra]|uniref:Transposase for insertion sequence element IS21-like C-terminal domain-containing protein n=1 Tax=Actinacidiphila glaucinigra TaxID=235986 RepID=A0A239NE91_9ACTN|nr:hypothetical protein SAMN05216252_13448 [Actinacidiphila glaucinigra]
MPADLASKGGTEARVRIAKRDLVPTAVNPRPDYGDFDELHRACVDFVTEVNARIHRETRQAPAELLAEERLRLHPVPEQPFTTAFGEIRRVGKDSTISVESVAYSVPDQLVDERVRSGLGVRRCPGHGRQPRPDCSSAEPRRQRVSASLPVARPSRRCRTAAAVSASG